MVFELLSLLLDTPIEALCWIKLTGTAYAEKEKHFPQPAWNRNRNKKLQQFLSKNEERKTLKTFLNSKRKTFFIWYNHRLHAQG